MPKQPGGVSKSLRVQTLVEILNRAGCLDKVELLQRLSAAVSVEKDELERALYRDLEDLVRDNKIQVFSRDSLGKIVENETEETKKYKKYWHTEKFSPFDIQGVGLIRIFNANVICNKQITSYLRISNFDLDKKSDISNCVLLHVNGEIYVLTVDKIIYPLKIIIARNLPTSSVLLDKIYKFYGKKVVLILLPEQIISAIKDENIKGELVINCNAESINIINENKKTIRYKEFDMAADLNLLSKSQKTRNKMEIDNFDTHFMTSQNIQFDNIKRPLIIKWTTNSIVFT